MGSSRFTSCQQEYQASATMDILQQSLQAADIPSGDDIFEQFGLTAINNSSGTAELTNEIEDLASQGAYEGSNTMETSANQSSYYDGVNGSGSYSLTSSHFDTSQFLNTSASVNADHLFASQPHNSKVTDSVEGLISIKNSASPNLYDNYANDSASQYSFQLKDSTLTDHRFPDTNCSVAQSTNYLMDGSERMTAQNSSFASFSPSLTYSSNTHSATTSSFVQAQSVTICEPVFTHVPTQTVATSSRVAFIAPADASRTSLPAGIRVVGHNAYQAVGSVNSEVSNTQAGITWQQPIADNAKQLITLVQKPATNQMNNGLTMQNQSSALQPNRNLAVLRVTGSKHNLNLSDPQVVKALTANLIQKQPVELQGTKQQFIKLEQNNSFINVAVSRPQQQSSVQNKIQQIPLQNGQTILLNTGQAVQICTAPTHVGQVSQMHMVSSGNVTSMLGASRQILTSARQSVRNNSQLPIKGIQIASVNIPLGTTNAATSSSNTVACNSIATPILTKNDPGRTTVNQTNGEISTDTASPVKQSQTVRSLLANSILKHNSPQSYNQAALTTRSQDISLNSPVTNITDGKATRAQFTTTLRLNLTPQQASQLTTSQLQSILKQHQAAIQAKALISNANNNAAADGGNVGRNTMTAVPLQQPVKVTMTTAPSTVLKQAAVTSTTNIQSANSVLVTKPSTSDGQVVQVYRIEPTLTDEQVEEVKKLVSSRTIASKINCLTRDQQQLVLAFQAQIKAMSPPVQQYYLRNPQLFMQKVLQQVKAGKPFILQVKTDTQQNKTKVTVSSGSGKPLHPTISLTQEPSRPKHNIANSNPQPSIVVSGHRAVSPLAVKQAVTVLTPSNDGTGTGGLQVPRRALKRPAPEHVSKVSLVLEQLECHQRMISNSDCTTSFRSRRDAIRRLVPFHTCNVPDAKNRHFEESEKIFDKIANRIWDRKTAMINKYHLLFLRDSTRDSCSAEMVMIERMFLQKEKAKLADDKARLKENPALIKEYFPNHQVPEEGMEEMVDSVETDDEEIIETESSDTLQFSQSLDNPINMISGDSNFAKSKSNYARTSIDSSDCDSVTYNNCDYESVDWQLSQSDSFSSIKDRNRSKKTSEDRYSHSSSDDFQLQEAVDSIL